MNYSVQTLKNNLETLIVFCKRSFSEFKIHSIVVKTFDGNKSFTPSNIDDVRNIKEDSIQEYYIILNHRNKLRECSIYIQLDTDLKVTDLDALQGNATINNVKDIVLDDLEKLDKYESLDDLNQVFNILFDELTDFFTSTKTYTKLPERVNDLESLLRKMKSSHIFFIESEENEYFLWSIDNIDGTGRPYIIEVNPFKKSWDLQNIRQYPVVFSMTVLPDSIYFYNINLQDWSIAHSTSATNMSSASYLRDDTKGKELEDAIDNIKKWLAVFDDKFTPPEINYEGINNKFKYIGSSVIEVIEYLEKINNN